jgi:hypothetical protein
MPSQIDILWFSQTNKQNKGATVMTTETRTIQQYYVTAPVFTSQPTNFQKAAWVRPDGDGWTSCAESFLPAAIAFDDMWAVPDGDDWAPYAEADEPMTLSVGNAQMSQAEMTMAVGDVSYRSFIAADFMQTVVLVDDESGWYE